LDIVGIERKYVVELATSRLRMNFIDIEILSIRQFYYLDYVLMDEEHRKEIIAPSAVKPLPLGMGEDVKYE
jgi:hypothetical protein